MRTTSVAAIALVLVTSGALAQNPPANDGPNNKAINSKNGNNPGAPVAGANTVQARKTPIFMLKECAAAAP